MYSSGTERTALAIFEISAFSIETEYSPSARTNIIITCAKLFGQPTASAIYFAVDYDALSSMDDTLKTYFDIIKTKLATRGYRTGVYGGGAVCSMLKAAGKVDFTWLAGASGWRGSSNYLNYNIKQGELYEYNGVDFDENVAMGGVSNQCDYGQWIFPKG